MDQQIAGKGPIWVHRAFSADRRGAALRLRGFIFAAALLLCLTHLSPRPTHAQNGFEVGAIVGLQEDTCIREGPGFQYRAHTRVPENDWAVKVTGGPRLADGLSWYDTSRAAAGDPSGGTGWVDAAQSDLCPDGPEPGRPDDGARRAPSPGPADPDLIARLRDWWSGLDGQMKWVWLLIALFVLAYAWQKLSLSIFTLLRIALLGGLLWWLMGQTRAVWEPIWTGIVGSDGPDLALLVALLPAVSWLASRLRRR